MTNTFAKSWQKMVRIVAGGDTITATNNHPIYLPQLGKYLRADSLRQNMKLLALTGALLTVHAVEAFDTTLQVYNFEVEEYHNYFVGEEGVLVHNDCVFVKMGLRNLPQQLPDDPIFDIFTNVFGTTPEAAVKRISFLQDYGNLSGQAKIDFENFFRAQDLITANPNISLADLLVARGDRVRAWEVFYSHPDAAIKALSTDVPTLTRYVAALAREGDETLAFIYSRLLNLRPPSPNVIIGPHELELIDATLGLQSSKNSLFDNVILTEHVNTPKNRYLYTIDDRGINIGWEETPYPTERMHIVHSNLSSEAYIGGEAWFGPNNSVIINAGSGRFGDGAGITQDQWRAATEFWENLGYNVTPVPFGFRGLWNL